MRPRILVVDYPHTDFWQPLGKEFEVSYLGDAKKALRHLADSPCHFAIVELVLPDVSGLELIKSFVNLSRRPYTIATTWRNDESYLSRALQYGADDFWLKPYPIEWVPGKLMGSILLSPVKF